ncbi:MAG: porin [Nitrospina sp.]|nr:porin [Nitrospina sp.]
MKLKLNSAALITLLFLGLTAPVQAGNVFKVLEDIEIHGFASSSYTFNFNESATETSCGLADPLGRTPNCLRIFDVDDNSFKFDAGELVFLKDAGDPGDIGFRFDLSFGYSLPEVAQRRGSNGFVDSPFPINAATGQVAANRLAGPVDDDFDVQQGFVTWNAPVGNGVRLDFGKFITHVGVEVFDGYDGWNQNWSRAFTFGLAIPFTHTGLRASYDINDKLSVMGAVFNGWGAGGVSDNNDSKSFGLQIAYAPIDWIDFVVNYVGGEETVAGDQWRNIVELITNIRPLEDLLFTLNFVYGDEEDTSAAPLGGDTEWWSFVGYARYDFNDWFSFNLRGEHLNDQDGFATAIPGHDLWEITVTPEFRIHQNMVVRLEYRHDESNINVFDDEGVATDSQDTVAVNALVHF